VFNLFKFIQEAREELKKVTWPTREQTIRLTIVVIIVSLIVSLYLGLLDIVLGEGLKLILSTR